MKSKWTALSLAFAAATALAEPSPFFGQHLLYSYSFAPLPDRAFDGLRLWGSQGTMWRDIEPTAGHYDFAKLDDFVAQAHARHLDLLYTLGQTPQWASARPGEPGETGPGAAAEPADMRSWSDYVLTVARRYRGRIGAYEVMNEPRIPEAVKPYSPGFFSGSTASLIDMTHRARLALDRADPGAKLVCPSIVGPQIDGQLGIRQLRYFLAQGGGRDCDIIGYHFYLANWSVDAFDKLLAGVKAVMAQFGQGGKPLWDTEIGWIVAEAGRNLPPRGPAVSDTDSARLMAKLMLAAIRGGIARTYWFAHDSSYMGSTLPDKRQGRLNVLGIGYRSLRSWLSGGALAGDCQVADRRGDCAILRSAQLSARIVWGQPLQRDALMRQGVRSLALLDGSTHRLADLADHELATLSRQFQDPVLLSYQ